MTARVQCFGDFPKGFSSTLYALHWFGARQELLQIARLVTSTAWCASFSQCHRRCAFSGNMRVKLTPCVELLIVFCMFVFKFLIVFVCFLKVFNFQRLNSYWWHGCKRIRRWQGEVGLLSAQYEKLPVVKLKRYWLRCNYDADWNWLAF